MKHLLIPAAAVMLTGCVPFLHPAYTGRDLVDDPPVEGAWQNDSGKLAFERRGPGRYGLTTVDDDGTHSYDAHLFQLGPHRFLDVTTTEPKIHEAPAVPVHWIARVRLNGDELELTFLEYDWIKDQIAKRGLDLPHEVIGEGLVVTANTHRIQTLLARYAEDPGAFKDTDNYQRAQ